MGGVVIPTPSLDDMIKYVDATAQAHREQVDYEDLSIMKEYHFEQFVMYEAIAEQLYRLKDLEK